jgi:ferredoxin
MHWSQTYKALEEAEPMDEEEEDMLDLAIGVTDTSRLGCQICVTKAMDGLEVTLPAEVANMDD